MDSNTSRNTHINTKFIIEIEVKKKTNKINDENYYV